ncbi:MAG: 3'-5' exonuclease [Flavobacteriaceae bacterium]|nr:3'-5' exonuclease [Flavobacteriaceae bacterium]
MLYKLNLSNILFLDIETVPEHARFEELSLEKQQLWEYKSQYQRKDQLTPAEFYGRAGIWAEFGKIVCISIGKFIVDEGGRRFQVRSFQGSEAKILQNFQRFLEEGYAHPRVLLCAHNGKEFDFPYIARRMLIHGIRLPNKLDLFGKKPWEVPHLDTMELWKFGDYKHYTSLKLLAAVLGVPSPKEDMDGSMVRDVYYQDGAIDRIVSYCELDVITTAQVLLRLRGETLLSDHEIEKL